MNKKAFHVVWSRFIKPSAESILDYYSQERRTEYGWSFEDSEEMEERIRVDYEENRRTVHNNFFTGSRMDSHKIASCIAKAILTNYPMSWDGSKNAPPIIGSSNYWLAFMSSVSFVYGFLICEYKRTDAHCLEKLQKQRWMAFPPTTPGHDIYMLGRVKTLELNDVRNVEFGILGYADMLYWIEFYNRQKIEESINPIVRRIETMSK